LLRITDQKVTFLHESARDYLLLRQSNEDGLDKILRIYLKEMHLRIVKKCVDALVGDCPISRYATQHWQYHARHSGSLVSTSLYYASSLLDIHSGTRDLQWHASDHQLTSYSAPGESRFDIFHDISPLRVDYYISVEP
jgi:hypothetical protein